VSLFAAGGLEVSSVSVGDRAASAVYLGGVQVWPAVEVEIERPLIPEVVVVGDGDLVFYAGCINSSGRRLFLTAFSQSEQTLYLAVISTRSLSIVAMIELPGLTSGAESIPLQLIAVNDGEIVYYQTYQGSVWRVDVADQTVSEVYTSPAPVLGCRLAAHPSGDRVYAFAPRPSPKVLVIDVETDTYDQIPIPGPSFIVYLDAGIHSREWGEPAYLMAGSDRVLEMDTGSNTFVGQFGLPAFGAATSGGDGYSANTLLPLSEELWTMGGTYISQVTTNGIIRVVDYTGSIVGDDISVGYKTPTSELAIFIRDTLSTTATEQTAFVFQFGLERVTAVNTVSREIVKKWPIAGALFLIVHPAGDRFYVVDDQGQLHVQPFIEDEIVEPEPDPDGPEPEPPNEVLSIFGVGTSSFTIPAWAVELDVIAVGAGGGGSQGGAFFGAGFGGGAGKWATATFKAGTDFTPGQNVSITVGKGGPGGKNGTAFPSKGINGTGSDVFFAGPSDTKRVQASGGAGGGNNGGSANQWGNSPGKYTFVANTYQGGVTNQAACAPGGVPGAGGAGSNGVLVGVGLNAGDGGHGRVWIRAYRTARAADRSSRSARSMRDGASPPFKGWQETENGFSRG